MKMHFASKTLIALAVAIAAAAGYESLANEQPMPPPATGSALPENIPPGTPVSEVYKLAQAGVDASVIQSYIANCPGAFNLDADKIISLTDAGVSSDMVNAMSAHDKAFLSSLPTSVPAENPTPPAPAPAPTVSPDNSPPPVAAPSTEMTVNNFYDTLTPYGQWVEVAGYGRCWRPTAVVYDATWQPYCDRGRWVYTDCGWYWNSDYSWGVTFHYGRWFNHPGYGWCWWPDTVWAPSWVTWRSSGDYCGWAPLPPYSAYQPGIGFTYRGGNVSVGFDFGLAVDCFTFVSIGHFCESHPRYYAVPRHEVAQIYHQTTIINNYNSHNHTIVNNGVPVATIGVAAHRSIQPVSVGTIANANRHGWRGQAGMPATRPYGAGSSEGSPGRQMNSPSGHRDVTPSPYGASQHSPAAQYPASQHGQNEPVLTHGNRLYTPAQSAPNPMAPANNAAPAHIPAHAGGFGGSGGNPQSSHPYVAPSATVSAPVNNMVSAPVNQRAPAHAEYHEPARPMTPPPAYSAPAAINHSQPVEPRQNYSQPSHNNSPSAPPVSAPVPSQGGSRNSEQGGSRHDDGRNQNGQSQNH